LAGCYSAGYYLLTALSFLLATLPNMLKQLAPATSVSFRIDDLFLAIPSKLIDPTLVLSIYFI